MPALLPFLMMTQLFLSSGSYIMLFAFFCGYPTAARLSNERLACGRICPPEARAWLYLCNNASIAFLTGYVCHGLLRNTVPTWKFLLWIYAPVILFGGIYYLLFVRRKTRAASPGAPVSVPGGQAARDPVSLDESIAGAFSIILKIGGYIMLFSIASRFLSFLPISAFRKALAMGVLEITNGLQAISALPLQPAKKTALIASVCAFGGLCSAAQTKSVITRSELSITRYLLVKLFCCICTYSLAILTY